MKVDNKKFVKMWAEAKKHRFGQMWIAEQLGIGINTVSSKATYLRSKGVKLPKLYGARTNSNKDEVAELNNLLKRQMHSSH